MFLCKNARETGGNCCYAWSLWSVAREMSIVMKSISIGGIRCEMYHVIRFGSGALGCLVFRPCSRREQPCEVMYRCIVLVVVLVFTHCHPTHLPRQFFHKLLHLSVAGAVV